MEIMQMFSSGAPNPEPVQGKIPAVEGGELFEALLNRLQAEGMNGETAEEVSPAALTAWLPPGGPADVSGHAPMGSVEEGMAGSWITFQQAENAGLEQSDAVSPRRLTAEFSGTPLPLSGGTDVAAVEGDGLETAAPPSRDRAIISHPAVKNTDHVLPLSTPTDSRIASGLSGRLVLGHPSSAGTLGRKAGESNAPVKGLGILESGLAEILRPAAKVTSGEAPGAAPAVLPPSPLEGEPALPGAPIRSGNSSIRREPIPPGVSTLGAKEEAKPGPAPLSSEVSSVPTGMIGEGDFPINRETKHGHSSAAELPDLTGSGTAYSGRPSVASSLSPATEVAALKQPFDRPVTESQILDQVVGRIAVDRNPEGSRMSIKLQPEELGRIDVDLTVEQGRIKAQMVAQNQQVQDVLERHLPRLREALEHQGLKLDQIQVSVDAHAGDGRNFSQQHRQTDSHPRSWPGAPQSSAPPVENEEVAPPQSFPPGKVSLRI